ncbi:MAG: helix-turn-helix transcriptional regulator, partial [Nanoarchaeota archaeon]|nr:helix-turn-helix transcriptional regulator [Nanoarchaeota archaeon]
DDSDSDRAKSIAEVLGSKTCRKIINYLAENKAASEKDLSDKLKSPINTIEYNLKKLLSSGFVQKKKSFFWSAKGKKIPLYELSNKSIIISHKKSSSTGEKIKSITPAVILVAAGTFAVWAYEGVSLSLNSANPERLMYGTNPATPVSSGAAQASSAISNFINQYPAWEWFLLGGLIAIFIFAVINWRKL